MRRNFSSCAKPQSIPMRMLSGAAVSVPIALGLRYGLTQAPCPIGPGHVVKKVRSWLPLLNLQECRRKKLI